MSETKLLSEIATLQYGGAFSSKGFNVEGKGLPLVRIRDVQRGYSETYFDGLYDEKYLVSDGDFLISMDGNFNLGQWQGGRALLNQRVCLIRDTSDEVDLRYLVAILPRYLAEIEARTPFVTVKHLSAKALNAIMIPIPDLQEQKRIADQYFLQKLIKQKRELQQELFEELSVSHYERCFGQRENFDWVKLGDITSKIGSGATPKGGSQAYKPEGIALIRSMNVHDRRFVRDGLAFIDDEQAAALSNVEVQENDILLNITGASVARVCRVPADVLPARVNQHVAIIRLKPDTIEPELLERYLTLPSVKKQLLKIATSGGATREALTKSELNSLIIPKSK